MSRRHSVRSWNLAYRIRNDSESDCELLWCEFTSFASQKIVFGTYYRPPNTRIQYFVLLRESFTTINNKFDNVFLAGDFNLPNFDWINQVPSLRSSRFLFFSKRSRRRQKPRESAKIRSRGRGWSDGRKRLQSTSVSGGQLKFGDQFFFVTARYK